MDHWTEGFEDDSLVVPEDRIAFNTAMKDYKTEHDAIIGGYHAKKLTGKPFKLPESLDKMKDETVKSEFTSQVHKLFGIEHAKSIEDLADLDVRMGAAENLPTNDDLTNAFKQFVVDNKISKANAQKSIGFLNEQIAKAVVAKAAKDEADKLAKAKTCNEALIAHPDFGSEEKVNEHSELLRRAIQNNVGLTAEEYEQFGSEMADTILTKNPVMARVMLKVLAPLAAEGNTDVGTGSGKPAEPTIAQELPKTAKAMNW